MDLINRIEAIRDIDESTLGSEQKHFVNSPYGTLRIYSSEESAEIETEEEVVYVNEELPHWDTYKDVEGYSRKLVSWIDKELREDIEFIRMLCDEL